MNKIEKVLGDQLSLQSPSQATVSPTTVIGPEVGVAIGGRLFFSDRYVTASFFNALVAVGTPVSERAAGDVLDLIAGPEYFRGKLDDEKESVLGRIISISPGEIQVELQYEEAVHATRALSSKDVEEKRFIRHELKGSLLDGRICSIEGLILNSTNFQLDGSLSRSGFAEVVSIRRTEGPSSAIALLVQGLRFFPEDMITSLGESRRAQTTIPIPSFNAKVVLRVKDDKRTIEAHVSPASAFGDLDHLLIKAFSIASISLVSWPLIRGLDDFGEVQTWVWREVGRAEKANEQSLGALIDDQSIGTGALKAFVNQFVERASSLGPVEDLALATIEMDRVELLEAKISLFRVILMRQVPSTKSVSGAPWSYAELLEYFTIKYTLDSSWITLAPYLESVEARQGEPGVRFRSVLAAMEFAHQCFLRALGWDRKFCSVLRLGKPVKVGEVFDKRLL